MLWDPVDGLKEKEAELIDTNLTQPLLRHIEAITQGKASDTPSGTWPQPLEPIPIMASNHESKTRYIRNIFTSKPGEFPSPNALIHEHPYLFWRVPPRLYVASLSQALPDARILAAIDAAISTESLWTDGNGTPVVQALRDSLPGVDQVALHNAVRLVGAGSADVVSMNSARLFALLGRAEWRYRLDAVGRHVRELEHGG